MIGSACMGKFMVRERTLHWDVMGDVHGCVVDRIMHWHVYIGEDIDLIPGLSSG